MANATNTQSTVQGHPRHVHLHINTNTSQCVEMWNLYLKICDLFQKHFWLCWLKVSLHPDSNNQVQSKCINTHMYFYCTLSRKHHSSSTPFMLCRVRQTSWYRRHGSVHTVRWQTQSLTGDPHSNPEGAVMQCCLITAIIGKRAEEEEMIYSMHQPKTSSSSDATQELAIAYIYIKFQ